MASVITHAIRKPAMFEILAHVLILMLIVAFALVSIAGNAMRHAEKSASARPVHDEKASQKLSPRIFALRPIHTHESTKAA